MKFGTLVTVLRGGGALSGVPGCARRVPGVLVGARGCNRRGDLGDREAQVDQPPGGRCHVHPYRAKMELAPATKEAT